MLFKMTDSLSLHFIILQLFQCIEHLEMLRRISKPFLVPLIHTLNPLAAKLFPRSEHHFVQGCSAQGMGDTSVPAMRNVLKGTLHPKGTLMTSAFTG